MDHLFKSTFQFTILLFVILLGATELSGRSYEASVSDWEKLSDQLLESGYSKLFVECDESTVNEIWKEGKNTEDLEKLIMEPEADISAKFLAANLLMSRDWKPEGDQMKTEVAKAYAYALQESKAPQGSLIGLTGNAWGLPINGGDMGLLAERLISVGDIAVPYLSKALDDITMLPYEGSEEATIADMHIVRVVDVATRIVVRIKGFVWEWSPKPKVRDASIGFMREHLGF